MELTKEFLREPFSDDVYRELARSVHYHDGGVLCGPYAILHSVYAARFLGGTRLFQIPPLSREEVAYMLPYAMSSRTKFLILDEGPARDIEKWPGNLYRFDIIRAKKFLLEQANKPPHNGTMNQTVL